MTIDEPADNAAAYSYTQPIRDTIRNVNRSTDVHSVGNSGTSLTLNPTVTGQVKRITLNGNCTFTFAGAVNGEASSLEVVLTQDATGGRSVTWPTSVKWAGGYPTLVTTANAVSRLIFVSYDGGTTWYGDLIGTGYA